MGGTALRYFYGLPRFSEDLDFNTKDLSGEDFRELVEKLQQDIHKEGLSVSVTYGRRKDIISANLFFKDVVQKYNISDNRDIELMVKLEVNRPKWEMITESKALSLYGYNVTAVFMSRGNMLSEKICALFSRKRGRDIYDTLFMLKRKFPFNEKVLKANGIELPIKEALFSHLTNMDKHELKRLAEQVRPFLFKEDEAEMVINAPLYAEGLLSEAG
jgi:predicted nucleotidyltransferase component of viral defense system